MYKFTYEWLKNVKWSQLNFELLADLRYKQCDIYIINQYNYTEYLFLEVN